MDRAKRNDTLWLVDPTPAARKIQLVDYTHSNRQIRLPGSAACVRSEVQIGLNHTSWGLDLRIVANAIEFDNPRVLDQLAKSQRILLTLSRMTLMLGDHEYSAITTIDKFWPKTIAQIHFGQLVHAN